jgi:hypothetical protein
MARRRRCGARRPSIGTSAVAPIAGITSAIGSPRYTKLA